MHVTLVHVYVFPQHLQEFIEATGKNHSASIREPGNRRFDVLQDPKDKTHFILYEVYVDPASAAAHKETGHYKEWREVVAPWMAKPREGVGYIGLFPSSSPLS